MIQNTFPRVIGRIWLLLCSLLLATALAAQGPVPVATVGEKAALKRHAISAEDLKLLKDARALTPEMVLEMPTARVQAMLLRLKQPSPTNAVAAATYEALIRSGGSDAPPPAADAFEMALNQAIALAERTGEEAPTDTQNGNAASRPASVAGLPTVPRKMPPPSPPANARPGSKLPADYEPILPSARFKPRPDGDASPRAWKWVGPANIGGRTRAIVVHPKTPTTMWAAGVAGGIWKSVDAGATWQPLPGFAAAISISVLALDPQNPDTIFAGTGEGFMAIAPDRGLGIFRSSDGGATWAAIPGTTAASGGYVNRIAFTSDSTAMLVATRAGLLRSLTFREPAPGKVEFFQVAAGDGLGFSSASCSPGDATRCVAGAYRARIFVSRDGGANWTAATGPASLPAEQIQAGRVELTYAAADPTIVYAGVDVAAGEIWRSTDGGLTFDRRSTSSRYLGNQGMHANSIWAGDPSLADLVVVGGVDLFRSTDGGTTSVRMSDWRLAPKSAAANQHTIVAHPLYNGTNNRIVYIGNDGGIFRHDDALNASPELGWASLNNLYGTTRLHSVAGNPTSGRLVTGAQDTGILSYEPPPAAGAAGAAAFRTMIAGDGAAVAADQNDGNVLYGSQAWMWVSRSTTGGLSADPVFDGIADAGSPGGALFVAPLRLDAADPATMLMGGASLWRSRDIRAPQPLWKEIKAPLMTGPEGKTPSLISAIESRAGTAKQPGPDLAWVGHVNGDLFTTPNALADQPEWSRITEAGSPLPRRMITRIRAFRGVGAADTSPPANNVTVFATFAGYAQDNLWQSDDGGRNWRAIHGTMPAVPILDITRHPRRPDWIYAATQVGLFASADGGASWAATRSGPSLVPATQMLWMGERLAVATYGRGLYWIDLSGLGVPAAGAPAHQRLVPSAPALKEPTPAPSPTR